jgi:hypothetical protein
MRQDGVVGIDAAGFIRDGLGRVNDAGNTQIDVATVVILNIGLVGGQDVSGASARAC